MTWEIGNFDAWHDLMPGKSPTIHVTGEVTVPTSGYTATLRKHEPRASTTRICSWTSSLRNLRAQ